MSRLPGRSAASPLFRICERKYEPWVFRDWATAQRDGTFGHRWDDPNGEYRVLYAGQTRVAAFVESLQYFIPSAEMLAACAEVLNFDPEIDGEDSLAVNTIPREWLDERVMGKVDLLDGIFADIARTEALQYLRERLARLIVALRLHEDVEFDLSMLFMRAPRALSQAVSRVVYEDGDHFAGLVCPSRFGAELLNVTLFERSHVAASVGITRASLGYAQNESLRTNDPDFQESLRKLNLRLVE